MTWRNEMDMDMPTINKTVMHDQIELKDRGILRIILLFAHAYIPCKIHYEAGRAISIQIKMYDNVEMTEQDLDKLLEAIKNRGGFGCLSIHSIKDNFMVTWEQSITTNNYDKFQDILNRVIWIDLEKIC